MGRPHLNVHSTGVAAISALHAPIHQVQRFSEPAALQAVRPLRLNTRGSYLSRCAAHHHHYDLHLLHQGCVEWSSACGRSFLLGFDIQIWRRTRYSSHGSEQHGRSRRVGGTVALQRASPSVRLELLKSLFHCIVAIYMCNIMMCTILITSLSTTSSSQALCIFDVYRNVLETPCGVVAVRGCATGQCFPDRSCDP